MGWFFKNFLRVLCLKTVSSNNFIFYSHTALSVESGIRCVAELTMVRVILMNEPHIGSPPLARYQIM